MYIRKKAASKVNQVNRVKQLIMFYGESIFNKDIKIQKNIINMLANDYVRNYIDDKIFNEAVKAFGELEVITL